MAFAGKLWVDVLANLRQALNLALPYQIDGVLFETKIAETNLRGIDLPGINFARAELSGSWDQRIGLWDLPADRAPLLASGDCDNLVCIWEVAWALATPARRAYQLGAHHCL